MMNNIKIYPALFLFLAFIFPAVTGQAINHWETIVFPFDTWHYREGAADIPSTWKDPGYDVSSWTSGQGGIGYEDGDDRTIGPPTLSLFMRIDFSVLDSSVISGAILHADYDDAFIAWLNGVHI